VAILLDQLGAYNASRNHSWIKGEGGGREMRGKGQKERELRTPPIPDAPECDFV